MKPLLTALQRLVEGDVEFIVVGGLACVIQGAPVMTFDVDIVHARTVPNVQRLLTALSGMNGRYRVRPDLTPSAEALLGPGHHLMQTDHGPLDVLGALQGGVAYDELMPHSVQITVGGATCSILGLSEIIRLKQIEPRDKDNAQLPVLLATLRRLNDRDA